MSVIIPALNEEQALPAVLDALGAGAPDLELIVVDAGSRDATRAVVLDHPTQPRLCTPDGPTGGCAPLTRGVALNAGAATARGEVFWFLHADAVPRNEHLLALQAALADPDVVGGAFEFGFVERGWRLALVEWINRARYRVQPHYYGDQGLFVRRADFRRLGGFPGDALMEDAHFCRDIRRQGRMVLLRPVLRVSARRFLRGGVLRVLWLDVRIWWTDLIGGDVQRFAARYRVDNLVVPPEGGIPES